ncbi:hypothetical protein [Mesorhizobium sp.]|uniref:hypothetical protein n=1 Tax=Mesorhizobium sp. TaxID=1871066 RepID=UPI001226D4F6|nr:hypothetical protein [Mesorhizobium sp.]TIM10294.1 MAG: hypothetical protein E5Y62_09230 [Mesorhizobium sp.]
MAPWANRFGLDARRIYNLIQAGEVVLIFEGFDELRNAGRAYDRHEHFNALWRLAYPGTKLIFTGRPNFFIDEVEKNRTLRVDQSRGAAGNAYTELWEIDRLQPDEVMTALSGFDPEMARSVVAAADKYTSFRDIVSRPSMLPVVATIWPEIEDLQKRGQQLTDAVLIERYLDAAYQRKEAEIESYQRATGAPSGATYLMLPRELRETFTSLIVWDMVDHDTRNTITRSRLDKVILENYRNVFKVFQTIGSNPDTVAAIRRFESRHDDNNPQDISEMISNEIASAGLFVSDPVGGASNLRLPHKQYYEYIIAKTAYDATGASVRTRILVIGKEKNDSIIARNVLREPNSIAYFSGICGDDFKWFGTPSVRVIIAFQMIAVSFVISVGRFSSWLSDKIKVQVNIESVALDDIIDAILVSVRNNARRSAIYAFIAGLVMAVMGVVTISVLLPSLGFDKLIRTFLLSFAITFGFFGCIWILARSMPKANLLELVMRYRLFQRGDWKTRTDTLLRRRKSLYQALETIKRR